MIWPPESGVPGIMLEDLPDVTLGQICSRLGVRELGRLACVSRRFAREAADGGSSPVEEGARRVALSHPRVAAARDEECPVPLSAGQRRADETWLRFLARLDRVWHPLAVEQSDVVISGCPEANCNGTYQYVDNLESDAASLWPHWTNQHRYHLYFFEATERRDGTTISPRWVINTSYAPRVNSAVAWIRMDVIDLQLRTFMMRDHGFTAVLPDGTNEWRLSHQQEWGPASFKLCCNQTLASLAARMARSQARIRKIEQDIRDDSLRNLLARGIPHDVIQGAEEMLAEDGQDLHTMSYTSQEGFFADWKAQNEEHCGESLWYNSSCANQY